MGLVLSEIHVVAAAIMTEAGCLVAQRSATMREPLCWEFPGGKVEPHEDARQALVREIREELDCSVRPGELLGSATVETGAKRIRLEVFAAELLGGQPRAQEHREVRWLSAPELAGLDWAPADLSLVDAVAQHLDAHQARQRSKSHAAAKPPTKPT